MLFECELHFVGFVPFVIITIFLNQAHALLGVVHLANIPSAIGMCTQFKCVFFHALASAYVLKGPISVGVLLSS